TAADVEQQDLAGGPAEPAPGGEEGHARLVLAGHDVESHPELGVDGADEGHTGAGISNRRAGGGQALLGSLVLGDLDRLGDAVAQGLLAVWIDRSVVREVLGETERLLVGGRRQRRCSDMSIDDEQVDAVGPDIKYSYAHSVSLSRSRARSTLFLWIVLPTDHLTHRPL